MANDRSMTADGCPSAEARFTTRPWASRFRRRPSTSYSSTSGRTSRWALARRSSAAEVDLDVEVPGVREDRAVLHAGEVLGGQHGAVAGDGDEDVAALGGLERRHHLEALHPRLERANRVDLADDDAGAEALRAQRDALAGPAVADDHDDGAGEQDVRRAQDAVDRRLAGAVAVVERALGARLVDGDHRTGEPSLAPPSRAAARARSSSPPSPRASARRPPAAPRAAPSRGRHRRRA